MERKSSKVNGNPDLIHTQSLEVWLCSCAFQYSNNDRW